MLNLGHQLYFLTWHRPSHFPHSSCPQPGAVSLALPVNLNHCEIHLLTNNCFLKRPSLPPEWSSPRKAVLFSGTKPGTKRTLGIPVTQHEPFSAQGCWSNYCEWGPENAVQEGKKRIPGHFIEGKACTFGILCSLLYKIEVMKCPVSSPPPPIRDKNEDTITLCPIHVSSRETLLWMSGWGFNEQNQKTKENMKSC